MRISLALTFEVERTQPEDRETDLGSSAESVTNTARVLGFHLPAIPGEDKKGESR